MTVLNKGKSRHARAIFLIGARACGKTTTGALLAAALGLEFIDMDEYLAREAGQSIAAIVKERGWPGFRKMESELLARLAHCGTPCVISTGGGAPLAVENREILAAGHVIWLKASAETLAKRLAARPLKEQRPALTGLEPLAEIKKILGEREPVYAACASHIADAEAPAEKLCADLLAHLRKAGLL